MAEIIRKFVRSRVAAYNAMTNVCKFERDLYLRHPYRSQRVILEADFKMRTVAATVVAYAPIANTTELGCVIV